MPPEADKPATRPEIPPPDQWVDEFGDYLYRYAMLRLHDPDRAADAVQETFVGALQSIDRLENPSVMRTWLVGILKHKIVDQFRLRRRERPASEIESPSDEGEDPLDQFFDAAGEWRPGQPADWGEDPSADLQKGEFWKAFNDCLSKLPARLAEAFALRVLDERSSEEVYKALDVSPTNLWVILYRARMRLRHCLEASWFGESAG